MASKFSTVLDIQEEKASRLKRSVDSVAMEANMKMRMKDASTLRTVAREKYAPPRMKTHEKVHGTKKVTKYVRKKIDFSQLDHIGNGVVVPEIPDFETTRRNHRNSASIDGSVVSKASSGTFRPKMAESDLASAFGSLGAGWHPNIFPNGKPRDLFDIGHFENAGSHTHSPVPSDFDVGDSVSVVNGNRNDVTMDLPPPPVMDGDSPDDFDLPPPPAELTAEGDWAPESYLERVVAMYDYQPHQADEIELKAGEIVFVTKKNEDGWYEGVSVAGEGLFPGNYVQTA